MAYLGFDIDLYPGDSEMKAWWSGTPFEFCGFYLGGPYYHQGGTSSWITKRSYLKGLGYGFLVLYVGRQVGSSNLTAAQGISDANNAVALAQQAGFPSGTIIYLDIEAGPPLSSDFMTYIDSFINQINNNSSYRPGAYCSYQTADQINNSLNVNCQFACWNINIPPSPGNATPSPAPDPSGCGVAYALDWQYVHNVARTYGGVQLTVDLNTSSYTNPSNG